VSGRLEVLSNILIEFPVPQVLFLCVVCNNKVSAGKNILFLNQIILAWNTVRLNTGLYSEKLVTSHLRYATVLWDTMKQCICFL